MFSNNPITSKDINDLIDKLEPKVVHMNQKMYDVILQKIDFEPVNVVINNHLPDNQALLVPESEQKLYFT